MGTTITPNMGLIKPGTGTEPGPDYGNEQNQDLDTIDSHNHTAGQGVQIPPAGLNINTDLPFNNNSATGLLSAKFNVQNSAPTTFTAAFSMGTDGDLYWNDLLGNHIQLTSAGSVAGASGGIGNFGAPANTASATFVDLTETIIWKATTILAANMDFATAILRYNGSYPTPSGTNWIALAVASTIASGYTITLPPAPPAFTSAVTMDPSGNIGTTAFMPAGTVVDFAGSTAPNGFLLCYGQSLSISTYADLFTAIGYQYGGSGGGFNVPDCRGVVTAGLDNMGGTSAAKLSGVIASTVLGTLGGDQYQQAHTHGLGGHTHTTTADVHYGSTSGAVNPGWSIDQGTNAPTGITSGGPSSGSNSTGAGASQNVQPTIMFNKIIKY
jgi:microcystin-dependent protein